MTASPQPQPQPRPQDPSTPVVHGLETTVQTQCVHWHSPRDIIAIRHACCGEYYACISCHEALSTHAPAVWPRSEWDTARAVLCGQCRVELTVSEYMGCGSTCPSCQAAFNPGCAKHYDLYFEMQAGDETNAVCTTEKNNCGGI